VKATLQQAIQESASVFLTASSYYEDTSLSKREARLPQHPIHPFAGQITQKDGYLLLSPRQLETCWAPLCGGRECDSM